MHYYLLNAYSRLIYNKIEIGKILETVQLDVISPAGNTF